MQKKLAIFSWMLFLGLAMQSLSGCSSYEPKRKKSNTIYVTLPPIAYLVKQLAGPGYKVQTLFSTTQDPHTFEPQTKQIADISKSDIFFVAGMPEEKAFEEHFENKRYPAVYNVSRFIKKRKLNCSKCASCNNLDPHTWLSPENLDKQAIAIVSALSAHYPENKKTFQTRYKTLRKQLNELNEEVSKKLKPYKGQAFFVYHPSFGYFAQAYGLKQIAIENEGKKPSVKHLRKIIEIGSKQKHKVVITQPQFIRKYADEVAREIGAKVYLVNPLSADPIDTIEKLADIISKADK